MRGLTWIMLPKAAGGSPDIRCRQGTHRCLGDGQVISAENFEETDTGIQY